MSHPLNRHPLVIIGLVAMVLALFAAFGPSLWNENHTLTESAEAKSLVAIDKVVVAPPPAQPVPSADEDTAAVAVQEPVSPTVPETVASTSSSHPGSSSTADLFDRWGCYDNNHPEESQVEPDPAVKPYMFGSDNHPGSDAAQILIHRHQHPANCKDPNTKFLVWNLIGAGIGSDLHTMGWALSLAMHLKRVLYVRPHWKHNLRSAMCRPSLGLDCWASPITSCTEADLGSTFNTRASELNNDVRVMLVTGFGGMVAAMRKYEWTNKHSPEPYFTDQFNATWWKAQALRYTLRRPSCHIVEKVKSELRRMFPETGEMPAGAISIHVRHGDKGAEMLLQGFTQYLVLAREIKAKHPEATTIFLSTEDPKVIETSKSVTDFNIVYTNWVPRQNRIVLTDEDVHHSFVNLFLAALCSHAVSTHASNWNRMIYEMQKVTNKYSGEYKTIEQPSCKPDISYCDW